MSEPVATGSNCSSQSSRLVRNFREDGNRRNSARKPDPDHGMDGPRRIDRWSLHAKCKERNDTVWVQGKSMLIYQPDSYKTSPSFQLLSLKSATSAPREVVENLPSKRVSCGTDRPPTGDRLCMRICHMCIPNGRPLPRGIIHASPMSPIIKVAFGVSEAGWKRSEERYSRTAPRRVLGDRSGQGLEPEAHALSRCAHRSAVSIEPPVSAVETATDAKAEAAAATRRANCVRGGICVSTMGPAVGDAYVGRAGFASPVS